MDTSVLRAACLPSLKRFLFTVFVLVVLVVACILFFEQSTLMTSPVRLYESALKRLREGATRPKLSSYFGFGQINNASKRRNVIISNRKLRILLWNPWPGYNKSNLAYGSLKYETNCSHNCELTDNRKLIKSSQAVLHYAWNHLIGPKRVLPKYRDKNQFFILWNMEAPNRFQRHIHGYKHYFNWTAGLNENSDFPLKYGEIVKKSMSEINAYNFSSDALEILKTKSRLASWVVSNRNGSVLSNRSDLVKKLGKYMPIDIYGNLSGKECPGSRLKCKQWLGRTYKFYLAFENSLCRDYVTEKFFQTLQSNMVPVVYGGANYRRYAPSGSYINVDTFASAKSLAHYLKYLDENDEEYLEYFKWKKNYRVVKERTFHDNSYSKTMCDICERLHRDYMRKTSMVTLTDFLLDGGCQEAKTFGI